MLINLAGHGFFTEGLGPESIVLDLGANEGEFSREVIKKFGCKVVAVEPFPDLAQRLTNVPGLQTVHAAISGSDGWVDFYVNANSEASTVRPFDQAGYSEVIRVRSITFSTLVREQSLDRIDVIKVDIEGSEVDLIGGLTDEQLLAIGQITMEFHEFNGAISSQEADRIEARLLKLGFHRIQLSRYTRDNVLFFNPSRCPVSGLGELWARLAGRNLLGLKRIAARRRGGLRKEPPARYKALR